MSPNGVIIRPGAATVKATIDRISTFLQQHGATIYSRIDQQDELAKNGLFIKPLEFLLFGNPKAGGLIIQENPVAALDLPLKIIAWEDEMHKVWVAFNDGVYVKERFGLTNDASGPLNLGPVIDKALGER